MKRGRISIRMAQSLLLASLVTAALVGGSADASEQSALLACFQSISPFSQGPGDDLTAWEHISPELHPTVAVTGKRGHEQGAYFYTGGDVYFVPLHVDANIGLNEDFDLRLPGRGPFVCGVFATPHVECQFRDDPPGKIRRLIQARPLAATASDQWILKAALIQRLETVAFLFRRKVSKYADELKAYEQAKKEEPGLLARILNMQPEPPSIPNRNEILRALQPCRELEDEGVRSVASSEYNSVLHAEIPALQIGADACVSP